MPGFDPVRRQLLASAAAGVAIGVLPRARAQGFPSRNMRVVIPTGQGGGADRLARVFDDFWGPLLKTNFEYAFFAGAAGQVGYEVYLNRREKDGHNLLFGNMGPEMLMYALQRPPYRFPEHYQYFCRLDVDDSIVFVRGPSRFQKIEDLADRGEAAHRHRRGQPTCRIRRRSACSRSATRSRRSSTWCPTGAATRRWSR